MATHTLTFHIAVIGPSDTERDNSAVKNAVNELTEEFASQGAALSYHHWSGLPPGIGETAQKYIDKNISWADMDFVVGLLWEKFGTPVEGARSGTEHEYRQVYDLFSKRGQPDLLLYFRPPSPTADAAQLELINGFRREVQAKALTCSYDSVENLRQQVTKHLRHKIVQKLAENQQVQRRVGHLPPNRRITVEMIVFAEFPSDTAQFPAIIILKNFQGEEFVFDTRTMNPQDLANWIAKSMGFAATEGRTLRDYLDVCNIRNLKEDVPMAQLWLGNILFADHAGLKLKEVKINIGCHFPKEKIPKFLSGEIPYFLPLPRPQISNDAEGRKHLVL
ncbi:MAG: hypothetical protein WA117_05725 [Verrucomicrobiia bacterium]